MVPEHCQVATLPGFSCLPSQSCLPLDLETVSRLQVDCIFSSAGFSMVFLIMNRFQGRKQIPSWFPHGHLSAFHQAAPCIERDDPRVRRHLASAASRPRKGVKWIGELSPLSPSSPLSPLSLKTPWRTCLTYLQDYAE